MESDHRLQTMVNLFVIGAQKSGTKALASFLGQHSDIQLANKQECHFFDRDEFFKERTALNVNVYHNYFDFDKQSKYYMDVTPAYLYYKESIPRLYRYNPSAKIICILRNPVDRAFSHWNMDLKRNRVPSSFLISLGIEAIWLLRRKQNLTFSFVARGLYSKQINRLLEFFPKNQCLFIKTSDLKHYHKETLERIYHFLSIDNSIIPESVQVHKNRYHKKLGRFTKTILSLAFRMDINSLEKTLDWNLEEWKF